MGIRPKLAERQFCYRSRDMTAEQWRRAWQIYDRASTVSAPELESFLNAQCPDPLVVAKVREIRESAEFDPGTAASDPIDRVSRSGLTLQHYTIEEKLGAGGSGEVYKAHDLHLDRPVAVKFLFQQRMESEAAVDRFLKEAKSASLLNHPNIVTIYDFIRDGDIGAVVMEFVDGVTLTEAFAGPVPIQTIARVGVQIARALEAAHSRGIVHCDIKPANIMVRPDGYVKLLDFGLAILGTFAATGGGHAQPAGTIRYMSPEQLAGRPVNAASDIYSLGLVFYELMTGRAARPQETEALLQTIVERKPPELRAERIPERGRPLFTLVRAMLSPDPEARPSASAVISRLESMGSSVRRQVWAAGLVLAGAAALLIYSQRSKAPQPSPVPMVLTSLPGQEEGATFSPDASRIAYAHDAGRNGDFRIYTQPLHPAETPVRLTSATTREIAPAWSPDGKMIAFVHELPNRRSALTVFDLASKSERIIMESPSFPPMDEFTLEWTNDSQWLISPAPWPLEAAHQPASDAAMNALYAFSVVTGEGRQLTEPSAPLQVHPSLSGDQRTLAYFLHATRVERITLQRLGAGLRREGPPRVLTIPGFEGFSCRAPTWLRATGRLAFLSNRSGQWHIWTVQVREGRGYDLRHLQSLGDGIVLPSYTRDGGTLIFSSRQEDTDTWRIDRLTKDGRFGEPRRLQNSTRQERHPRISPDGNRIAFQSDRTGFPEIWISDMEGANAFQVTNFSGPITESPSWSPDGRMIVFESRVGGHAALFRADASQGARPERLDNDSENEIMPSYSADGRWIYFNSNRLGSYGIWRMPASGGPPEIILNRPEFGPAPAPDGRFLYAIGGPNLHKSLRRIDPVDGQEQELIAGVMDRSAAVTDRGVYSLCQVGTDTFRLVFVGSRLDPGHPPLVRTEAILKGRLREGLSATRDGATIVFTRQEQRESNLMLVRDLK